MNLKRSLCTVTAILAVTMALCAPASAVSAQHAIVTDALTGTVLFEKDADARCLIASTTKIMTGLIVCEECGLDSVVEIPPEAVGIEGSSLYLKAGERVRTEDLLYGMLLRSGNDAAAALAIDHSGSIEAFADRMNERAGELGLNNTHFANPHGLDDDENFSTCEDLAKLASFAMQNPDFARIVSTKEHRFGSHVVTNHNKLLWRYDGADGVKTGFTKAAGRILVSSAVRSGRRLICVTIDAPDDWNDHASLLDDGFARFEQRRLSEKGQIFGAGLASAAAVDALMLPEEEISKILVSIGADGNGRAEFWTKDGLLAECPLAPTGETYGGQDPEDHSVAGRDLPQGG